VFFVPALLKESNYTMPIGALSSGSGSSNGGDDSCCALAPPLAGSSILFPAYIPDLAVCKAFYEDLGNNSTEAPAVKNAVKNNKSTTSKSSSSKSAKAPKAPAPAAKGKASKGKAGAAASAERYPGDNEGYYEGIAMVVSGPMYIANWDTEEQ
jgi:hypothetical protein